VGTIRKRSGAWFVDYVDATGRRRREMIGPGEEKRRLARQILAHREAEATLGQHHVAPLQTPRFGEFADDWLRRQRARGLKPKTLESYEGTRSGRFRSGSKAVPIRRVRRGFSSRLSNGSQGLWSGR
jgi:hypothetical protein